jgi:fatty-acid peroxygenase
MHSVAVVTVQLMVDLAWRLLRQGYDAVARDRLARGGGDDFESRLMGRRAVVVRSREGARAFYDESLVRRRDAVPKPLAWLLFGRGAIHGLDAPEHRERKAMFLQLLTPDRLSPLVEAVGLELRQQVAAWPGRQVEIYDELIRAYGRAVLGWAGVTTDDEERDTRSRQLAAIVDGFGFAGPAYARAWRARLDADRWATRLVEDVRRGQAPAASESALDTIARSDLPPRTAGVELLNVLRPTVAVAWLGTFGALRLAHHPQWRARLADPDSGRDRLAFAQEVRRTTPFVPALVGRVHRESAISGVVIRPGDRLVLDVVGVDHDPARWPEPDSFDPGRFIDADPGAFDLVPQGGGDPVSGHRCPGESVALLLVDATVRVLARVDYSVTDGGVDHSRMPTLPGDGLVVRVRDSVSSAGT